MMTCPPPGGSKNRPPGWTTIPKLPWSAAGDGCFAPGRPFPAFSAESNRPLSTSAGFGANRNTPTFMTRSAATPVMHSSAMLRRSALVRDNIVYNPDYSPAEDYDLCRQLLAAGWQLANLPEVLFCYHYHGRNYSLTHKKAMRRADRKVKNDILKLLGRKRSFCPYFLVMLQKLRLKKFPRNCND